MNKTISKYIVFLAALSVVTATVNFVTAQKAFSDLSPSHPNYAAIIELQKRGIVGGYPDGSFHPERAVNRVEALKMITLTAQSVQKMLDNPGKQAAVAFPDIEIRAWYMPFLKLAMSYDVVSGYPDGLFRPEKTVNLVESLKMALKAFEVDLKQISVKENPYADAFLDQWYAKYVEYARRNSLIDADGKNKVYPDQGMKRGTLAEVMYRLLKMTGNAGTSLIYHGVATHSWSTLVTSGIKQEDLIKSEVDAYEAAAGRTVSFVEFAHEWKVAGPAFPIAMATSNKRRGATPFIFLNLRTTDVADKPDPVYNLAAIISGKFDTDFIAWADAAKKFGSEIIVSWGWEMNGDWSAWSGPYNGGPVEGPKRFREAYRHIVELMQKRGANNIRWAFHINFPESPDEPWNYFENYYPGNDVIDLVGASIYSAQFPTDNFFPSFESLFDPAYSRLVKMAPKKPVYVFEFGAAANNPLGDSAAWADKALADILSGRWPAVRGFAWWNDYWEQDSNPAHDTELRVEKLPGLAKVFQSRISEAGNIGDRTPIFSTTELPATTSIDTSAIKK